MLTQSFEFKENTLNKSRNPETPLNIPIEQTPCIFDLEHGNSSNVYFRGSPHWQAEREAQEEKTLGWGAMFWTAYPPVVKHGWKIIGDVPNELNLH